MGCLQWADGWAQAACQAAGCVELMRGHTSGWTNFRGESWSISWSKKLVHACAGREHQLLEAKAGCGKEWSFLDTIQRGVARAQVTGQRRGMVHAQPPAAPPIFRRTPAYSVVRNAHARRPLRAGPLPIRTILTAEYGRARLP